MVYGSFAIHFSIFGALNSKHPTIPNSSWLTLYMSIICGNNHREDFWAFLTFGQSSRSLYHSSKPKCIIMWSHSDNVLCLARVSNPRPVDYQTDAMTTDLPRQTELLG
uniref:Uncharacterized protein n=1 Tax=Cacopsylla melanoneura TaxID=428564 RepID=A0A8D8XAJ5_9HEMI